MKKQTEDLNRHHKLLEPKRSINGSVDKQTAVYTCNQ